MKNVWTKEETDILKAHWSEHDQRELHEKFLPAKTPVQICQKKMYMGLKKPPVWTNEERALLLEHGASHSQKEMVKRFLPNKTVQQVHSMRKHLGIRRRCTDIRLN
jgi:hypothetical protein